jgi:tetratricopeptide (TPR) repeat protein
MRLYDRRARPADAVALFRQLTQLQPKSAVNHFYLGNVYVRQKRYDDAERAYQKVVNISPDRPDGYIAMVQLYLVTKRKLPEARELAAKAAKLKPNPQAYFLLAVVCSRSGDRASAVAAIERAMKMDPRNVQYRRMRESLR